MEGVIKKVVLALVIVSCIGAPKQVPLSTGVWRAELQLMDKQKLPFNFKLAQNSSGTYQMELYNAQETIIVDEIYVQGDSITIQTPVFEGFIAGKFTTNTISGQFIKPSLGRVVPFEAVYGDTKRFEVTSKATQNVTGVWQTEFSANSDESYMAKGIFSQKDLVVSGTFRTNTGDYRYLEGVLDGDSLKLSAFDGAHAFLFTAKVDDSIINGNFYSGNHFKEPFIGRRNQLFELPNPDSLTFLKKGYDILTFAFPDSGGNLVSLEDERFRNKVVIVQIMGTWCPNCLDETKFLTAYLDENQNEAVAIVALAFESAKTKEAAFAGITRLQKRIGVTYPILLAQYGTYDKDAAQQKLPMLNRLLSYPTTLIVDKKGKIRKIHTGFNGPATGIKFEEFKLEFVNFVASLIAEK